MRPPRVLGMLLLLVGLVLLIFALLRGTFQVASGGGYAVLLPLVASSAPHQPPIAGEEELAPLNAHVERTADCSSGCWRLMTVDVQDPEEGGGRHHIYVKAFGMGQLGGIPWHVGPGDPGDLQTKSAPDWADYAMFRGSCYDLVGGASGPHVVTMGPDAAASDAVIGVGLPHCHHYSFYFKWMWQEAAKKSNLPPTFLSTKPGNEALP